MSIDGILEERGKRYGNYFEQASISNSLLHVIDSALRARQKFLHADQADALNMICVKISRIINGDADYGDSWRDIAGYATLVADRLEEK